MIRLKALRCSIALGAVLGFAAAPSAGSELEVQQIDPAVEADDCRGVDCPPEFDDADRVVCVRDEEGGLPPECLTGEDDRQSINVDGLIPRIEDQLDGSPIPLIPGITINR